MSTCTACTRPSADQATLCKLCTDGLRATIASVPSWSQRLTTTRTRQSRTGSQSIGVVNRSDERPVPWDERAARSHDRLRSEVVGTVRVLADDHPGRLPDDTLDGMAAWLLGRVDQWRHHEAAAEMWDSLIAALDDAERTVDRPPPRVFLGSCKVPHEGIPCPGEVYAREKAHETDCDVCGHTHDVEARRSAMLAEVESYRLTASECSRALSSLHAPINAETIRQWATRKRLVAHGTDEQGRPTYRVSDVLDLILQRESGRVA